MKVPVWKVTTAAYRDALRVMVAMPVMTGIVLVVDIASIAIGSRMDLTQPIPRLAGNVVMAVVLCAVLAPCFIAMYRHILLDERPSGYRIDPMSRRFQRYVLYSVLFYVPMPIMLAGDIVAPADELSLLAIYVLGLLAFLILIVKAGLIFPAIAVEAVATPWAAAVRASRGNFWRILAVYLLGLLPAFAALVVLAVFSDLTGESYPMGIIGTVLSGVLVFVCQLNLIAAGAELFRLLESAMRDTNAVDRNVMPIAN